ncbi:MAG: hypothetical protein E6K14_09570 [Methanobacteriota archaeon]|nr:MAG: hypothetical protein E6K14_09570 [Euryarchaeota archaeon]
MRTTVTFARSPGAYLSRSVRASNEKVTVPAPGSMATVVSAESRDDASEVRRAASMRYDRPPRTARPSSRAWSQTNSKFAASPGPSASRDASGKQPSCKD